MDSIRKPAELLDELLLDGIRSDTFIERGYCTIELIEQRASESGMPSKLGLPRRGEGRSRLWVVVH